MLDKTKKAVVTAGASYSPTDFVREMKAAVDKATAAGVDLKQIAHATMGFAHSVWDECYGDTPASGELLDRIQKNHPSWGHIESSLTDWGYQNDLDS